MKLGWWLVWAVIVGFGCPGVAVAADWPRLGGPGGTGVSSETGLARRWPKDGPRVLWTTEVAEGFAGAAIHGGEVFVLDRLGDREDVLRCFDLETGLELWKQAEEAPGKLPYNGSRNVPTVDGQSIITMGPFGHLRHIDRQTRRVTWARHLVEDFKDPEVDRNEPAITRRDKLARAQVPMWGLTQAPVLYEGAIIVAPQTEKTGLVAYERASGKIRWRSDYIGRNWYGHVSPYLTTLDGIEQILMLAQPSDPEKAPAQAPPAIISSVDPKTGRLLWKCQTPGPYKIPIPQPVRVGPDRVFITGGYGLGCFFLRAIQTNGQWQTQVLDPKKTVAAHIHSPVLYEDRLYVMSFREHGGLCTGLVCLDRHANTLWQTGPEMQFDAGGFLLADGLALVMHGRAGELYLFELTDPGARLLAQAKVLDATGGMAWAPLALSRGRLVVRDQNQMKCLDLRSP
jgi:outer membrane protein assembly factor BamB